MGIGGPKEKFRNNMAAVNLLHELEFDNRLATPEEQEILSKYVGFGGLADAFDESKEAWSDEYKELIVTYSPDEYAAARESTLTAFYTPPVVIRAMYDALQNMGFSDGNILEPSCGTGHFIGMLPQSMQNSKFYGVELDSISGADRPAALSEIQHCRSGHMKKHHSPTAFLMLRSEMFCLVSLRLLIRNMTRIIG